MKNKLCNICKLGIDDSKQYAEFIHYKDKKKVWTKAYYHINCFQSKLSQENDNKKIQAVAMKTLLEAREKLGLSNGVKI